MCAPGSSQVRQYLLGLQNVVAFCDWNQLKQGGSNSDAGQSPQWQDYGTMVDTCSSGMWKPLWETTPDREIREGARSHSFRAYPLDNSKDIQTCAESMDRFGL